MTRQFWAYAVENGLLPDVRGFLNAIPHASFVHGAADVDYLKRRHDALIDNPLFASMEFIADQDEFARRLPLMAAGRDFSEPVALGWAPDGTDVDFGALSRQLIADAAKRGMTTLFGHEVRNLSQQSDRSWTVSIVNRRTGGKRKLTAKFVFLGAGGGAVPLLQKSGIPEAKGFGGFPVGGAFLRTDRPALTAATPSQGVQPGLRRALRQWRGALGHSGYQRQVVAAVRTVRELVAEVLEAGRVHRSAAVDQAEQPGVDGHGRAHPDSPGALPDRPAAAV